MIPALKRLPRSEFSVRGYKTLKTPYFSLKIKTNRLAYPRFGVIIGVAAEKKAVKRNFWKRQARAVFMGHGKSGKDYILIFLKKIKEIDKKRFKEELLKLFPLT